MYVIKDRIESIASSVFVTETLSLRPGRWSADNADNIAGTGWYIVVPNLGFSQPYLSADAMHVEIFHTNFDVLGRALSAIIRDLNTENPHDNGALYTAAKADGFLLHNVTARVSKVQANDFIEGTDYYVGALDILIEYGAVGYVELADSMMSYIGA